MTKRIILTTLLLLNSLFTLTSHAQATQQVALIDMQYLMSKIPEAVAANKKLQTNSEKWQKEIQAYQENAKKLYLDYQRDLSKLDAATKVQREEAIVKVEESARNLQEKYFGPKGEMRQLQEKLITPIQNKIYEAVKLISQRRGYLVVLDRASSANVIYANPDADISNDVLTVLGYSN